MNFSNILAAVNNFVWGPVMLVLLVGTGIFLTIRLKFLPWRNLGFALKSIFGGGDPEKQNEKGGGSINPALSEEENFIFGDEDKWSLPEEKEDEEE